VLGAAPEVRLASCNALCVMRHAVLLRCAVPCRAVLPPLLTPSRLRPPLQAGRVPSHPHLAVKHAQLVLHLLADLGLALSFHLQQAQQAQRASQPGSCCRH
jgi:hypothetical protein